MKAIAIFEMDEKLFDELSSNKELSMMLHWDYDIMWNEQTKFFDHVVLRPMPTKKVVLFDPDRTDEDEARRIVYEIEGYNRCVAEMLGETE